MRVVRAKTVARMDRMTPEPQLAPPPARLLLGGPLPPASLGLGLELQGYDPRRLPRPELLQVAPTMDTPGMEKAPSALDLILQVSGQSAASAPPDLEEAPPPWEEGEWTSSDQDEKDDPDANLNDGEAEHWDYRRYRYKELEKVRKAPEPQKRRVRRPARPGGGQPEASDDGDFSPWRERVSANVPVRHQPSRPCSRMLAEDSDSSTPRCEEEFPDEDLLRRVADALFQFYRLPGDREQSIRTKHVNAVMVTDAAWAGRKRDSHCEEPPMMWIRGGRVYDFHGDRGTVAEFEFDLLTRQVEDDAVCRLRRREQGLMPFPFAAFPLKERNAEEQPEEALDGGGRRRPNR